MLHSHDRSQGLPKIAALIQEPLDLGNAMSCDDVIVMSWCLTVQVHQDMSQLWTSCSQQDKDTLWNQ